MPTYTMDLATEVGAVRLNIGDGDIDPVTDAQFSDEEITLFLGYAADLGKSGVYKVWAASGFALIAWAVELAREDQKVSTGSWSADRGDVAGKMNAKAQEYFDLAGVTPAAKAPALYSVPVDWTPDVKTEREATD